MPASHGMATGTRYGAPAGRTILAKNMCNGLHYPMRNELTAAVGLLVASKELESFINLEWRSSTSTFTLNIHDLAN
jgi:hypothetical protein